VGHTRRLTFIPAVDGLRALAIVMVMAHHAIIPHTWFDGARGSVDVFFVISGFLITSLVTNEFDKEGRVDLKRFYRRRAYRLLPAVTVMIIGVALYATVDHVFFDGAALRPTFLALFYAATYVTNWAWAFGAHLPIQFIHLWTLAVEEQFYFLAPISLAIALPRLRRTTIITSLLVLCAAGVAWRVFLVAQDADRWRVRFGLDTHADALLLGCVIGLIFSSGKGGRVFEDLPIKRYLGSGMLLALAAMTFVDIHTWAGQEAWAPSVWALMGVVAVVSVIGQSTGWHVRVLQTPFIQRIGKVSYALYLWHLPVQIYVAKIVGTDTPLWLRTAIAWAIAYGLAELSWRLVEAPAQHLRTRREQRRVLDLTEPRYQSVGA
jgi:peptidoglycan/LPS O-acetylase OafA/YrhL